MQVEGLGQRTAERIVEQRSSLNLSQLLEQHIEKNPNFWTPVDPDYPRLLLEIPNPPPVLYYRGAVNSAENCGEIPSVAVVGTRHPTEYGRRWTQRISSVLARSGFTIASGMASGIDTIAHRSCLEVGGRTIAVFGTGVDIVYPRENRELCQQVLQQGLVLSEYPAGTKPNPNHFPHRNRIVAGLSRAIFVMEAGPKSGALITANVANEFCRDVYVLPGRLDDQQSQGCLKLISGGAGVIPVDLEELLEQLGAMPPLNFAVDSEQLSLLSPSTSEIPAQASAVESSVEPIPELIPKPIPELTPQLAIIFAMVTPEPVAFDVIVEKSDQNAGLVSGALLQLELMGLITQLPGMRYQRHPHGEAQ